MDSRRHYVSVPLARLLAALVLAAPLAAAAQTAVPQPARPIILPAPVMGVPGTIVAPAEFHGAVAYDRATGEFDYGFDCRR